MEPTIWFIEVKKHGSERVFSAEVPQGHFLTIMEVAARIAAAHSVNSTAVIIEATRRR